MKSIKKIIIIVALILVIIGGIKVIKSKKEHQANESTAYKHQYKTMENNATYEEHNYELYTAKLKSIQNPQITTKISGYIEKIFVEENKKVKKGDVLIKIDSNEFDLSLKQILYSTKALQSNLSSLQQNVESLKLDMQLSLKTYNTNKKLYNIGGISKEKLDLSQIVYEQKRAKYLSNLDQIEAKRFELQSQQSLLKSKEQLKTYYTIYAPIDGVVEKVIANIGDLTSVNKPLITLISNEQELTFSFASELIKQGQEIYIDSEKIGEISFISPSTQNYLKVANIKLDKKLQMPINSMVSVKVKIK
jgi:multidrug resistance efflux pump